MNFCIIKQHMFCLHPLCAHQLTYYPSNMCPVCKWRSLFPLHVPCGVCQPQVALYHFLSEVRQILIDQLKCFDSRTEGKLLFLADLQEFFRRLSEIELDYSRNLERLSRMYLDKLQRHKTQRYINNACAHSGYTTCNYFLC